MGTQLIFHINLFYVEVCTSTPPHLHTPIVPLDSLTGYKQGRWSWPQSSFHFDRGPLVRIWRWRRLWATKPWRSRRPMSFSEKRQRLAITLHVLLKIKLRSKTSFNLPSLKLRQARQVQAGVYCWAWRSIRTSARKKIIFNSVRAELVEVSERRVKGED